MMNAFAAMTTPGDLIVSDAVEAVVFLKSPGRVLSMTYTRWQSRRFNGRSTRSLQDAWNWPMRSQSKVICANQGCPDPVCMLSTTEALHVP
jgi:hypothetical protein